MKIIKLYLLMSLLSFLEYSLIEPAQQVGQIFQNDFKLLYGSLLRSNFEEFYLNLLMLAKKLKPEELRLLINHRIQNGTTLVHILIAIKTDGNVVLTEKKVLCLQALFNDGANFFLQNNEGVSGMDLLRSDVDEEVGSVRFWVIQRLLFDSDDSLLKDVIRDIGLTQLISKLIIFSADSDELLKTFSLNEQMDPKLLTLQVRLRSFIYYYAVFMTNLNLLINDVEGNSFGPSAISLIEDALNKMFAISLQSAFDFEPITFDMNYMLTSNFMPAEEGTFYSLLLNVLDYPIHFDYKVVLLQKMLRDSFHVNLNQQLYLEQSPPIFYVFDEFVLKKISLDQAILLWQILFQAGADINCLEVDAKTRQNISILCLTMKSELLSTVDKQKLINFFLNYRANLQQNFFLDLFVDDGISKTEYSYEALLSIAASVLLATELSIILNHSEFKRQECNIDQIYNAKTFVDGEVTFNFSTMLISAVSNLRGQSSDVIQLLIEHGVDINQLINKFPPICHFADVLMIKQPDQHCLDVLDCIQVLIANNKLKLLTLVGLHAQSIPDFVKSCFETNKKSYPQEIQEKFKVVFNQLMEKYNAQKREQEKIESDIQQKKAALVQAKKEEENRLRAEQLVFQRERGRAAAEEKNEAGKKQRLQALEENFKVRQENSKKKYEEQEVLLTKQLESIQEQKAQLQGLSNSASKAKLATISIVQSWTDLLKVGNLNDIARNRIKNNLKNLSLNFSIPVSAKYQLSVKEIGNKKNVFIDMHHILSATVELDHDDNIDIKGAHFYDTIQKILVSPLIEKFEKHIDLATGCVYFKLFPVGKNARPIIKTTFPEDWTVDNIYQSLTNSEFIAESQEADLWIVTVQTQKDPKLKIKLVFKPTGTFNTLITAIPLMDNPSVSLFSSQQRVAPTVRSKTSKR